MSNDQDDPRSNAMSARKFVGFWALGGFILGLVLGNPNPGSLSAMIAEKIGVGVTFAVVGAALGAAVNYFFRSQK